MKVSIGGRPVTNLHFADGSDAVAEHLYEQALEALVESLNSAAKENGDI